MSLAEFVAFNLYLAMLILPLRMLGMWIGEGQRATASGERIFQVIDEPEEIRDRPARGELPAGPRPRPLRAASRSATTRAARCCDGIDLELEPGRTVALIGHTGSGKTTLASLDPALLRRAGRARDDRRRRRARRRRSTSLRREIGVIAQDPFLFSATVRENIAFGRPEATDEEIERAARLAQAHEFIAAAAGGLRHGDRRARDHALRRPAPAVAIARALVVDPRILILDDATASVDATTEARIRARPARGDARPDDGDHRPPALDDRARRRDRRPRRRPRSPRAARTTSCSGRARSTARSTSTGARARRRRRAGGRVRVWQPGGHLARQRGAKVEDWSWAQTKRRLTALYRLARPVQAAHRARDRARCSARRRSSLAPPLLVGSRVDEVADGDTGALALDRRRVRRAPACSGSRARTAQTYFTGWTGERMLADLRNHLFRHLQRLSLGFYERNRAGVLISRMTNDVEALDQLVTDGVTSLVQNTLTLVGTAVILFFLDWRLALATLTVMPAAGRRDRDLPQAVGARVPRACARRSAPSPRRSPRTSPACASCRRSRASAPRARTSARSASTTGARTSETVVQNGLYFPFVDLLSTVATAIVLGYGGYLVFDGDITIGDADRVPRLPDELLRPGAAALAALQHVPVGRGRAGQDHGRARRGAGGARRRRRRASSSASRGHVRFDRVRFALRRPGPEVLHGIDLDVPRRDDRRARRPHRRREVDDREADRALLRPDRGRDHDRRRRPARRRARSRCAASSGSCRRRASCSPARSPRTSPSAGPTRRREEVDAAARAVGADEFIERLEDGYETQLGERGLRLSLGQRQLVAFARALLADPRILILDEATSSVDIGTERRIERALRRLLHGRTAFIIAHRLSTIRDADLIVVLEHGRVVEQGTHDELLAPSRPLHRALRRLGRRRRVARYRVEDRQRPGRLVVPGLALRESQSIQR